MPTPMLGAAQDLALWCVETRNHIETAISIAAPFLDLVLSVGERISRVAEPTDFEYYPIRDEETPSPGDSHS